MELLTYSLENRGNTPVYMYIYECIKNDILTGRIMPGERLPSKRPLASHLGVAIITIENAYAQLITEGYIQSKEKKGYYVSDDMEMMALHTQGSGGHGADTINNGLNNIGSNDAGERANHISFDRDSFDSNDRVAIDFSVNSIKADSFPFDTWARIMRKSMLDHEAGFTKAPDGRGVEELRKAIAAYLYKSKGITVSAERIIVGPGTEYLHHILIQLIGRSCFVAVENPGYKKVGRIYETNGVRVLHIPVDEKGMIIDRLKDSNVRLVHLSPSHHFPTGTVMPIHRRGRLLKWAKEQGAYIVEDDYDSEFRFEGRPVATLYSMDQSNVIYMNTFTKTLAQSIRIAYMILPEKLYDRYREKLGFYSGTVSGFEQYTLAEFISGGYYERHIRRVRNQYKKCRQEMLDAINESGILEYINVTEDKAGLQLVFEIKPEYEKAAVNLCAKMLEAGVKIVPFSDYCYGLPGRYENSFLLYYSDMGKDMINKAFYLMSNVLKN